MRAQQNLEWQFSEDAADPAAHWQALPTEKTGHEARQPRPSRRYELLLTIAMLYGVAVYLIWQQATQRIAMLEEEVATLQRESALQSKAEAKTNGVRPPHHPL